MGWRLKMFHLNKLLRTFKTSPVIYGRLFPYNLADIGEGIKEVTVKEWYVKVGQKVDEFENICDVSSDKANVTISSRYAGIIRKIYHNVDDLALVGQPLVDIEIEDGQESDSSISSHESDSFSENESSHAPPTQKPQSEKNFVIATPSVRRLAKEYNINLDEVTGTGKGGRILNEDVLNFMKDNTFSMKASNDETEISKLENIPLRGAKKKMYDLMTDSTSIPHFYVHETINSDKMMSSYSNLKTHAQESHSIRLTVTSLLIKACSMALIDYPIVNSKLDKKHENIVFNNQHNIGVAMNTPTGLIVPVVRNVQSKNLVQIAQCLQKLSEKGEANKLTIEDLSDGTFTISNTAPIGGLMGNSIIVPPQAAILSFGRLEKKLEKNYSGEIVETSYSTMVFSGDHRLIDGFTACNFLKKCKTLLENPLLMLVNQN